MVSSSLSPAVQCRIRLQSLESGPSVLPSYGWGDQVEMEAAQLGRGVREGGITMRTLGQYAGDTQFCMITCPECLGGAGVTSWPDS